MKTFTVKNLCLFLLSISFCAIHAQNGVLDTSFNGTGVIDAAYETANSMTTDKNNKVLVIGHDRQSATKHIFVNRYASDGSPDKSFGNNGQLQLDVNSDYDYGRCIKALNNGQYLISGQNSAGPYFRAILARINQNGTLDSSFGVNGFCIINPNQQNCDAWSFEVSGSGSIYVSGYRSVNSVMKAVLWKVKPKGFIDSSFGTNGEKTMNTTSYAERFYGIDMNNGSNTIVAVGISYNGAYNEGFITMIDTNGKLQTGFNSVGYKKVAHNSQETRYNDVSLSNSQIIVVGHYVSTGQNYLLVNSILPNGAFNPGFASGGIIAETSTVSMFTCIIKDCKENFFLGGAVAVNSKLQFRVLRLKSNGLADSGFASNGYYSGRIKTDNDETVEAMTLYTDSGIVFGGRTDIGASTTTSGLMRLKTRSCKQFSSIHTSVLNPLRLRIYPNPVKSSMPLSVKMNDKDLNQVVLKIISSDGQLQFISGTDNYTGTMTLLEGMHLPCGFYNLIVETSSGVYSEAFVIE